MLLMSACIIDKTKIVGYDQLGTWVGWGDSEYAPRFCVESSCTPTWKRRFDGYGYRMWENELLNGFSEKITFIRKVKF